MFNRRSKFTGRHNFGRSKKETHKNKKHRNRVWIFLGKNKHGHDHDDDGVMMSGDSSPPPLRVSVPPSPGFDLPDDGRHGKTSPTTSTSKIVKTTDEEAIEEALPIIEKTLPVPEPKPKLERNGAYDIPDGKKKLVDDENYDDSCVIKCISFTQQCCDCTIL